MVALADVVDKTFAFYRVDGTMLSDRLQMNADGSIAGSPSASEQTWEIRGQDLLFLNADHQVTTRFWPTLVNQGTLLIFGAYLSLSDIMLWHVLWEVRPQGLIWSGPEHFERLQDGLQELRQTVNLVARRTVSARARRIRVLFLIHSIESWDCLSDVNTAMRSSEDFEPIVASLPRRFPGERQFGGEHGTHEALSRLHVRHLRFAMYDPREALEIIKALEPDVIFRQSPWENDVSAAFGTHEIGFARLCYVPYYGFNLLARFQPGGSEQTNYYADQTLHRMCWRIFSETESTRELMRLNSARDAENVVVTGHPKLDRLYAARNRPAWPIDAGRRAFRLIWAPHHSIGDDWLGFGTFLQTHAAMLEWAREDAAIDIVLKPHPALFTRIRGDRPDIAPEITHFLAQWARLSNTALVEGGDYGPLLAASDAMLTDGISFLAEYQLFGRPLVFLDSGRHAPFNPIGQRVIEGASSVKSVEAARHLFASLRAGGSDSLAAVRRAICGELLPFPGKSTDRILEEIRRGLAAEMSDAG